MRRFAAPLALFFLLSLTAPAFAQEPAPPAKPTVKVPAATLDELKALLKQISEASQAEATAKANYEAAAAMRAALQQALEAKRLKALMAEGVTDADRDIDPEPKAAKN